MRALQATFCAALCVGLVGCASSVAGVTRGVIDKVFEEDATEISASFDAAAGLNPNVEGRPSPLRVRLYALRSTDAFERSGFFALDENDTALLGADIEYREQFTALPGSERTIEATLPRTSEARHVAVVAAYQDIDAAVWRATLEIRPHQRNAIRVELDSKAVSMALSK